MERRIKILQFADTAGITEVSNEGIQPLHEATPWTAPETLAETTCVREITSLLSPKQKSVAYQEQEVYRLRDNFIIVS